MFWPQIAVAEDDAALLHPLRQVAVTALQQAPTAFDRMDDPGLRGRA
jgi:hypothetical protein